MTTSEVPCERLQYVEGGGAGPAGITARTERLQIRYTAATESDSHTLSESFVSNSLFGVCGLGRSRDGMIS